MKNFLFLLLLTLGLGACAFDVPEGEEEDGGTDDAGVTVIDSSPKANDDVPDGGNTDEDKATDGPVPSDALGDTTEGTGRTITLMISANGGQIIEKIWGDLVPTNTGGVGWDTVDVNSDEFRLEGNLLDGDHRVNGQLVGGKYLCGYVTCEDSAPAMASGVTVTAVLKDGDTSMTLPITCEGDHESGECVANIFVRIP